MTFEEVRRAVEEIAEASGDPERAHALEDRLYKRVLAEIAESIFKPHSAARSQRAAELARVALKSQQIEFPRNYA